MNLPIGTVSFLFTDIEGSTRLWETDPSTMKVAVARHDTLMRQAINAANGVVFKTGGDSFFAAFANAADALAAALAAQFVFHNEPWPATTPLRVRMAVHTGAAEQRNGDYFGQPLNRVARLMAAGHGGQILLSAASFELVRDQLPEGVGLLDLGLHRLKDLERAENVYQVTHPDVSADFPPLKSLDNPALPNNLPPQVTSFVGREKVIADVTGLLAKTRLLTLTGSGGSGKTRLSLQTAADVLDGFPDGAWLIELAPLADPALVPQTVAQVLGIKEQAGQTIAQTLADSLKTKQLLLVLDNCEHLLSACAGLAATLLRSCPNVKVLATSREPLGIAGETTYRVPSLSLPDPKQNHAATAQSLSQYEAVQLFIERAQAVRPTFSVTNTNAPALAQLCHRLDGIPLALELAAARVRSLSVEDINTRLDNRFRLLVGGDRSALPRQQTLQTAVDWSYDLLNDPEKALFNRLSIFAGGWTMEAAEEVCGFAPLEAFEVLDVLTSLVDKSLVLADEPDGDGTTRYRMLETLRQYGAEKRDASGESGEVKTNYRDYFVGLAEEAQPKLIGPEQVAWLNRLESEHDNLRAVLDYCAAPCANVEEDGLRLVGALWWFWNVRGYLSEGREQATRALKRGGKLGETEQAQRARARVKIGLGALALEQGDYAVARLQYEEGLALYRELGNKNGIAHSLTNLGLVANNQGDYKSARSLHEESLALFRESGYKVGIADALNNLGLVANNQGDYVTAHSLYEESLTLCRELGDRQGIADALNNLGVVARRQGDYAAARSWYEESIVLYRELRNRNGTYYLGGLALVCLCENNIRKAVVLVSVANSLRESLGATLSPYDQAEEDESIAKARLALDEAAFSAAWEQGRAMTLEQAADYALDKSGQGDV